MTNPFNKITVDAFNKVSTTQEVIPQGCYLAKLEKSEEHTSIAGNKNIKLTFVVEGKDTSVKLNMYLPLISKDPNKTPFGLIKIKEMLEVLEIPSNQAFEILSREQSLENLKEIFVKLTSIAPPHQQNNVRNSLFGLKVKIKEEEVTEKGTYPRTNQIEGFYNIANSLSTGDIPDVPFNSPNQGGDYGQF